jgi:hypothetical protein
LRVAVAQQPDQLYCGFSDHICTRSDARAPMTWLRRS